MRGILGTNAAFVVSLVMVSAGLVGQTTWTGAASSVWNVAGNWSAGVPNAAVNAVIAAGTPNAPSTSGVATAACLALTVNAGAVLTIAPGFPLAASGSVNMNGSIAGGGTLRLVGTPTCVLSAPGAIGGSLEVSKTPPGGQVQLFSSVTVNGNLTQTSGDFMVGIGGTFTVSVSGNAQFQGGTLSHSLIGIIDVAGNVTFSGTTMPGNPTIQCGGNWSSNAAFAPANGLVVFDGTGAQTVTTVTPFAAVTIASTSSVTPSSALTVNGSLAINGSLSMTAGALDLNGSLTVGATGSLALGSATHTFGGSFVVNGGLTATGTVVLDGGAQGGLSTTAALPNLQISKASGGQVTLDSNVTINGNLTQTSGSFLVSLGGVFTMSVSGNAHFQGGTLFHSHVGIIDVAGNVTFSGTTMSGNPTIHCAGSWVSNAAFAPANGLVVFDGVGAQTLTSTGPFSDVTVVATSNVATSNALTLNGSLAINGSLSMTSGALDLNGSLTVAATGSLALASGTHTFGGSFVVNGGLTATGTVVLDGGAQGGLSTTAALPNLQISKASGGQVTLDSNVTINGNLTQTSGSFLVSLGGVFTMSVSGNAHFQGGTLFHSHVGIIDVAGNVTFSGTTMSGNPTIHCAGSWVSNAAFAPANGLVVFDGVGAQTLTSTGPFSDVTVVATSNVATSNALTLNGSLAINGSLSMTSGALDLNGSLTVAATGSLALASGTHTFGGSFVVNGGLTASGTFVFDGGAPGGLSTTAALPNVQISKTAGGQLTLDGNVTVNGNLTQTSGSFLVSLGGVFTMSVSGNAHFQGGTLFHSHVGIIDVAGNVTFSGTTMPGNPTIRCGGNWVSDAALVASGTVELDGAATTTIAHAVSGGTLSIATLVISNGTRTMVNDFAIAASSMTIASGGGLSVSGGRRLRVHHPSGATAFAVNGALSVAANGELSMGPQTTATVGASGSLILVGSAAQPAKITGEAGGGYGLAVNGSLAARHFVLKETGPFGVVVNATAAIAPAPNDLRDGTFDFRTGAPAGSVLLDLRRQAPAGNFDNLAFLNTPGASGVFNVKTDPSGVPISFTNWTGAFAGPSFENDPNNLIAWNLQGAPGLASFAVVPGAELAEIVWTTTSQANVTGYQIRRAASAAGPFAVVVTQSVAGPGYGHVDAPLPANQAVFYALYATMSGGDVLLLGTGSATPYSAATPGNVRKVGGNGAFANIQDAINAASDPNSVVRVTPGTYPSFTIGATSVPSNLRILGDGTGPVTIDTSSGPIQIVNVPPGKGVELSDLVIGTAGTAQDAIVVANCSSPVVLDSLTIACNGSHVAVSVSGSPSAAIQRSDIQGGTGLSVSSASYVAISRGSLSSLVATGSTIEMTSLAPGSVNVTPPGSMIARAGLMPDMDLPEFISLALPSAMHLDAPPNAPFMILASPRLGFTAPPPGFEMPVLVDPNAMAMLPGLSTDPLGQAVVGFEIGPIAALLGFSFTVQVVIADPGSGAFRLSNVESMVCIP